MAEGFDFGTAPSGLGGGESAEFTNYRVSGRAGINYPSPFFDAAHTYLPKTLKALFRWCRYYFFTNPLINAVCYKMASYPITDLIFESEYPQLVTKYSHLRDSILNYRQFLVEVGLDYQCYGNAFVSVHYPFLKHLKCKHCKHMEPARELRKHYKWRDLKFQLKCPKCDKTGKAEEVDVRQKSPNNIKLIRWDPERISIDYSEETGESRYFYRMSARTRNQLVMGKPEIIENIPSVFAEAARKKKQLLFSKGQIFHMKRPTIAGKDQGWGMSRILPVLKDAFYLQVLKKGQESIAREHIVPLRVLFPQAGSGTSDPYTTVPLQGWKSRIEEEIVRWRQDPNYIPVLPLPVGHQVIGGQGRAMVLHQEHRVWAEHIIAGLHVPQEFIFGGLSYSGTNVSMRNLENEFLNYRTETMGLTNWVFDNIGTFMGWPTINKKFRRFKMADDLQRTMLYFQANQAAKISDSTFLRELNEDIEHEDKLKKLEQKKSVADARRMQVGAAVAQAEAQGAMQRYQQATANDMIGGAPGPGGAPALPPPAPQLGAPAGGQVYPENASKPPAEGVPPEAQSQLNMNTGVGGGQNVLYVAKRAAKQIQDLLSQDPEQGYALMNKLKNEQPNFYGLVLQILQSRKGTTRDTLNPAQQPVPEVKPPRRDAGKAIV